MNAHTIQLVQASFQKVLPIADQAMIIFYEKLFEINPSVKVLFPTDTEKMGKQRNKLRNMLAAAVAGLSDLQKLVPILEGLGQRHATYGVQEAHYDDVGNALISTLQTGLGDAFTVEVKRAWIEVYGTMASVMIQAGKPQESVPSANTQTTAS